MATDEIITKYLIETGELKAQVSQIVDQYGKVDTAAEKSAKVVEKAFTTGAKSGNKFATALNSIGVSIVAAFSAQQLLNFTSASIKAFAEAEKSSEKLKFSVISLGKEGESAFKKLEAQAKKLGAGGGLSFFDDDDIKKSQDLFVQFGLTAEQTEKLIPGVLDLAVALDQDLGTATAKTISALTGTTMGLKLVGGDFKHTGSVIGNYNKILEVTGGLSGTAAAGLDTVSGKLREQENILGDLQERVGEKLAPAWVNLKIFSVGALDAIISGVGAVISDFRTLLGLRGSFGDQPEINFGGDVDKIKLQELSTKELSDRYKELKTSIVDLQKNIDNNVSGGKGLELQKQKLADLTAERDAIYEISAARLSGNDVFQKIITDTSSLSKKELQDYISGLELRTDAGKKFVEDAIESAQKRIEEIEAAEKKALEDSKQRRADALKSLQELEQQYADQRLINAAKDEIEILELKRGFALRDFKKGVGSGSSSQELILQKSIEKGINEDFDNQIADKKVEIAKQASDEMDKILDDLTKENERRVNIDYANFKADLDQRVKDEEEAAERIKQAKAEALQNSIALVGELMNIQENLASQRLVDLEYQREQDRMVSDEQQQKLQDDLNNRLITQAQYENESAKLKSKRVSSEKDIEKKINDERHKADQAAKDRAIFEATISAALAVVKQLAETPLPAGAPFIALVTALGLAQIASVASRPLPKYAEGTRYLDRNGNKRGKDTIAIMADEGERIIPRKQNVRHWKLYNSIDDGSFDKLIHDTYVLPALVAAQKKNQKHKQETFAENIAKSFMTSGTKSGNDFYDLKRLWSKGIRVTNLEDIISDDIKSPYR